MAVSASRSAFPPLLPVGFHRTDLPGLGRLCVDYFPASRTRAKLMDTVAMVVSLASRLRITGRVWVAGGFLSEAENPADCIIALALSEDALHALDAEQREFFDWFRDVNLYEKHHCRNYALVLEPARPEFDRLSRFWYRQFGFHAAAGGCGAAEIQTPAAET